MRLSKTWLALLLSTPPLLAAGLAAADTPAAPAPAAGAGPGPAAAKTWQVTFPSGLQYTDLKVGEGPATDIGQKLTLHYTGTLDDGTKFDSSRDRGQPFTFTMGAGEVIRGWDQGLRGMQRGGHRILHIPPALAYGSRAMGPIPANSWLTFDVELLDNQ